MMLDPRSYVEEFKKASFEKLVKERERLYKELKAVESVAFEKEHESNAWLVCPSPDVKYQVYLQYLAALSEFMAEKYRQEVVWGEGESE